MYPTAKEFKDQICFLADVCDKPQPSDKKIDWYYNQCRYVDSIELKRAMNVFALRMKWPSGKDLLLECGIHVPPTREEQEKMDAHVEGQVPDKDDPLHHLNSYGFWCFLSEIETNSEQEGKAKLDKKTEELKALGWNIWKQDDFKAKKVVEVGNHNHEKRVQCRKNWSFRFAGEPDQQRDELYLRRFQEGLIKGALQNEATH